MKNIKNNDVTTITSKNKKQSQFIDGQTRIGRQLKEAVHTQLIKNESLLKNTYIDDNGHLCRINLFENSSVNAIPFASLWNMYGTGKMYDPNAPQQRRDKQHSLRNRKEMLLSYIRGEDLGKFILQKKNDGNYYIIDGRQRSSLINEFLRDQLRLNGSQAYNFWLFFLNDSYLFKEKLSSDDTIKSNRIIKTILSGKTPGVKYSNLPSTIQDYIMWKLTCPAVVIQAEVTNTMTNSKVDESQWNMEEVTQAITSKFIDINQYQKTMSKKDMVWGNKSDCISRVRDFLEDKPSLGVRLGYTLKDKCENGFCRLDDTNEVRKLMILLSRALLIYQNTLHWGASEGELVKIVLNSDLGDFKNKTKSVWGLFKKVLNGQMMSGTYYDNGNESMLHIPEEFTKSSSDILKLSYFLSSLYIMDMMLDNNYGYHNGYFSSGVPTKKLYKLFEKVSEYLTLGKLANINHEEWNRIDLPLVKYDLSYEFYSNEKFDGVEIGELMKNVKDFNQHQKGLSKNYERTFRTLIKYSETKI